MILTVFSLYSVVSFNLCGDGGELSIGEQCVCFADFQCKGSTCYGPEDHKSGWLLHQCANCACVPLHSDADRLHHWDSEFKTWQKVGGRESSSGVGSALSSTTNTIQTLKTVIKDYAVASMVDIPCGDMNWMSVAMRNNPEIYNLKYKGIDIAPSLINRNQEKFSGPLWKNVSFATLDIVRNPLQDKADLVLNRDMLFHLVPENGMRALQNIAQSGSHYLLSSYFPESKSTKPEMIDLGARFYRINLCRTPFNLPPPISIFPEVENGKYLGLWDLWDARVRKALFKTSPLM